MSNNDQATMPFRRINLFAGPGAGKSTTAAWIFSEIKALHLSVELVTEYVKMWAYLERAPREFDQVYLFAKQQQHEFRLLSRKVQFVVTDSPTFLSCVYARKYNDEALADALLDLHRIYEEKYPSINIFLERGDKPFHNHGRWQSHNEAMEIDGLVREGLDQFHIPYKAFHYQDRQGIMNYLLGRSNG